MDIDLTQLRSVMNPKCEALINNKDRHLWLWGGGDAGKSHGVAQKFVLRMLQGWQEGIKHSFLVIRKTQPSVRGSAFKLVRDKIEEFGLGKLVKVTKNPMEITFPNGGRFIFAGLDDPEKIKSMEAITSVWAEEVTELTEEDYLRLDLILRGFTEDYMQIIGSFNPVNEQSWIKKQWFDTEERKEVEDVTPDDYPSYMQRKAFHAEVDGKVYTNYASYCHFTYKDNRFVTDAGIATLEGMKEKNPNYYNIYCLGNWGVLRGIIYEKWETVKEWPHRRDFDAHSTGLGLDFGFTNSPSALVECGFIGDDCYVRELLYEPGLTNPAICSKLRALDIRDDATFCADCAEPKSIAEIQSEGYNVYPCKKGKDSIVYGIQRVKQYNLKVYYDSPNLIKELNTYAWAEDKEGKSKNIPVDFMNHLMDAMRYIIVHLKGLVRGKVEFGGGEDKKEERKEKMREAFHVTESEEDLMAVMQELEE